MSTQKVDDDICCPPIDTEQWDNKTIEWNDKPFIREKVFTIMYIPFGFAKTMTKVDKLTRDAGSTIPDGLCLSDHTSSWNMDIYVAVDNEIPNAQNTQISGKFYCKIYEGAYNQSGQWMKDFKKQTGEKGLSLEKIYTWYTTCPKCAKKYDKNYVAFFGKFE